MTYSFADVQATIIGPGGTVPLGAGSGSAEEGITVEFSEETDTMSIGADGTAMHSLHASKAGRITVRLQKTSPTNYMLTQLYNYQRTSSLFFGQNILEISNPITGDNYTCQQVAFARYPNNNYAKEAGMIEWEFNAGIIDPQLGSLLGSLTTEILNSL